MRDVKKGHFLSFGNWYFLFTNHVRTRFWNSYGDSTYFDCFNFYFRLKDIFFIKLGILGLAGIVGLIVVAPYRMARIISF